MSIKPNYIFVKADICDFGTIQELLVRYQVDGIIHLAAESHVDRSIKDPFTFAQTNVMGTLALLQAAKLYWESLPEKYEGKRFYHISTDEVYGALEFDGTFFTEETKYQPHSPYSASKASSDHFVRAFHDTYGMPTVVTNCSNNYGPYQFPEKLIPLFINNIRHGKPLPVFMIRYAIDSNKLKHELGWEPSLQFEEGIERTVRWYLDNQEWMDHITSGEYEKYYESMYKNR